LSRSFPELETPRLVVRPGVTGDASAIVRFFQENREHLTPWWPRWNEASFSEPFWERTVRSHQDDFRQDRAVRFFLFDKSEPGEIIGLANFNQIVRGVAHSCVLGYGLAKRKEGAGYMTEALTAAIRYIFEEENLHRIGANYIPRNERSGGVLKRLGFVQEGYAKEYLFINGRWEDHILTSLTNSRWRDVIS
jgi:ribosomal-protein-alanine N-acetyltransferase